MTSCESPSRKMEEERKMMSKRRIQITDLQKQEIEEKRERRLLIRFRMKNGKEKWRSRQLSIPKGIQEPVWLAGEMPASMLFLMVSTN